MINLHIKEKMKHAIKFYTFLNRNPDAPFTVKKCVAQACVLTSIVYGSETWFTDNYGKAETTYNKIVKSLLDVRQTTCTELCFVEAGMSSFKALVHEKMRKYNLKVETGRWSRINRENRTCSCEHGGIQVEEHVTSVCG